MSAPRFEAHGKQVFRDGEHFADAADTNAAQLIARGCGMLTKLLIASRKGESVSGWQPIETAPRHTPVDLWVVDRLSGLEWREPDAELDGLGWFTLDIDRGVELVGCEGIQVPTHWRAIPAGPDAAA